MDDMLEALSFPRARAWVLLVDEEYGMELVILDSDPEIDPDGNTFRRTLSRPKVGGSPFTPFKASAPDEALVAASPVYVPSDGVALRRMREELRLTLLETGARMMLNSSARRVWDLCDGRNTPRDIARRLAWYYGMEEEQLLPEVDATLQRLHSAGVLTVAAGPGMGVGKLSDNQNGRVS